jgi:ArsR family transcriptional regulator
MYICLKYISTYIEITKHKWPPMRELLAITKALADENRLRSVGLLGHQELCLCQIVEVLGLASSSVSRHMSILQQARLVESRKEGRWAYFRLADDDAPQPVHEVLDIILASLSSDKQAKADLKSLKTVLKIEPGKLCRQQSQCKC